MKNYNLKFKIIKIKNFTFLAVVFSFTLLAFRFATPTFAAKSRVWQNTSSSTRTANPTRPSFSVKLRADRRAININFYNINQSLSINYELTYVGNNIDQGVVGSVRSSEGNSASRLLLFGTCSKNVCTYHKNITDAQLKITAKLNNGQTLIKKYKIKV